MKYYLKKILYFVCMLSIFLSLGKNANAFSSNQSTSASTTSWTSNSTDQIHSTRNVIFDYGHANDGYVMIKRAHNYNGELRVYIYADSYFDAFLMPATDEWTIIPLANGSGTYTFKAYIPDGHGAFFKRLDYTLKVDLKDPISPYLVPGYNIDYSSAPFTVLKAKEITASAATDSQKAKLIHDYVTRNIKYDYNALSNREWTGQLKNLDKILSEGKGTCTDYAAVMCGMLRSQGIPARMVYGYVRTSYHAWVEACIEGEGWIRYDPTRYSVSYTDPLVATDSFIANDSNYHEVWYQ